ncbi:oxidoreductase [Amycolatopsis acidicola]|uniref:Oxidoreductase n=1 Tax=Amycolatopsis acidicola TaxID=2596893 RepID=A0A5N0VJH9_9PSEU|nr:oxidoreductase [Amycolatopsis acidicola]KAA9164882.1 oxidoreductase [Amycolatopsis acidicola]
MTETITATAAGTWQLGDRTVNRLGYGAMRLMPMKPGNGPAERERAIAVLRRAVELGVNHIDTAAFYAVGPYASNELINSALGNPYPEDLVITTKVGPGLDPVSGKITEYGPEYLRSQVEQNLRELGRDHLDVVNLRIGDGLDRGAGSLADRFGVLAELREQGMIRHLGISNVGPDHLREAQAIAPVVCVQNQYGLTARREDDDFVKLCAAEDIAFVPFFAIASGGEHPAVTEIAAAHGVSAAQVRLAWTLHQGPNVLAIPGTGNPDHVEENIAAAGLRLSEEEVARLDSIR